MTPTLTLAQAAIALLPLLSLAAAAPQAQPRATTCNGSPSLCTRSYANVTFIGAHDSFAVSQSSSAGNQDYDVTQQLTDGIRMLQNQAHSSNGTLELCHTSCSLLDAGTLQSYLSKVAAWLASNPNDVVTLLLVNSDDLPPTSFAAAYEAAGLDTLSYKPAQASLTLDEWPTLGDMIDQGTRLVTFMDTGADWASVPYIIDEFSNMWETAFDVTTVFDCAVNRTHGDSATQLSTINHFLDTASSLGSLGVTTPNKAALGTTNAVSGAGSLGAQAAVCLAANGRAPNFMLVDFYEVGAGSVFQVAAGLNGVTYDPATPIASAPASASGGAQETSVPLSGARRVALPSWEIGLGLLLGVALGGWAVL
ncbi:PLC-like phosphodiesterase [Calocera cornea HHB12733]|uniref:PLC-like phosphodiesterase n=1 Tax=Calocera cornea HHB12733 TaxID=1353952 RepID=A0A165GBS5_9BASI|nr:PLC-like phosphodiesterase [Calocera cornea HHB12733]